MQKMEDLAVSLEREILDTKDWISAEHDETHFIFLTDHLAFLQYQLDQVNAELYQLRQQIKIAENAEKFAIS